jgi:hypothetical protein
MRIKEGQRWLTKRWTGQSLHSAAAALLTVTGGRIWKRISASAAAEICIEFREGTLRRELCLPEMVSLA